MGYSYCYLSGHSLQRAKERCGIKNVESASRHIALAYERGKRAADCSSWERSYLESCSERNAEAVAYDGFCYLFSKEGVCITLFKLPRWFEEKKHFDGKKQIRDYKKYCRSNEMYFEKFDMCAECYGFA